MNFTIYYNKLKKIALGNFLLALFFIRLQPFYYLPFTKNPIFSTHSLARFLLILNIPLLVFLLNKKINILNILYDKKLEFLFILFFISQSLSIINVINIPNFLAAYKELVFFLLIFWEVSLLIKTKKEIKLLLEILIITYVFNVFFMMVIFFIPELIKTLSFLIYDKYLEVLEMNAQRGRHFIEFLDFSLIPLVTYYFLKISENILKKLFGWFLLILIFLLGLISNFRTHIFMIFISIFGSVYFIFYKKKLLFFYLFIISFLILNFLSTRSGFFSKLTIERFALTEEETGSIIGRFKMWDYAKEMFSSSPLFGIGLGNYYNYLPNKEKQIFSIFKLPEKLNRITLIHPHSIFYGILAETGIFGILSLSLILFYFVRFDFLFLRLNRKQETLKKAFIISFWSLFFYSIFNPSTTLHFYTLFIILRVFIHKDYAYY